MLNLWYGISKSINSLFQPLKIASELSPKAIFLYIIFIFAVIFAGVYLIIIEFKRLKRHHEEFYQKSLKGLRESFRNLKDEDEKISLLNKRLDKRISEIANLYEITKEMSATLLCLDIFEILAKFLRRFFSFKNCKLILVDQKEPEDIDKVYRIRGAATREIRKAYTPKPKASFVEPDEVDKNLVKKMSRLKETIKLDSFSRVLDQEKHYIPKNVETFLAAPLIIGDALIGILTVENLSLDEFDNFLILSRQFMLEMKKVELYEKVQELAITDGLTGAYVRRHFLERLDEELKRSRRHKFKFSFLMLDIDHFKACNDTYGHLVGDAILAQLVNILKASIREIDLVARYGGEEFSVVLPETGRTEALLVAERIRKAIAEDRFKVYDEFTSISVSIGVAVFPDDAREKDELIEKSDKALYRAKREGRNRVCTF